jgi:hypothetical protein
MNMNNQKGFANIILIVVIVVLVGAVGYFAFVKKSEPVAQQPTPTPTATQSTGTKVEYVEGQYIDVVGTVREYGAETGGGKDVMNYIMVRLPEEKTTDDIFETRISGVNVDFSCVDETLRTGDMARVRGIIEKVIPDIGLILSCNSSKTSITKN